MVEILKKTGAQKLTPDLVQGLIAIHRTYSSEERGFPYGCCKKVSREIAENHKLNYQEGLFKGDLPNREGELRFEHAWCTDANGTIVDLTIYQYRDNLVLPPSNGLHIISLTNPLYKRYLPV